MTDINTWSDFFKRYKGAKETNYVIRIVEGNTIVTQIRLPPTPSPENMALTRTMEHGVRKTNRILWDTLGRYSKSVKEFVNSNKRFFLQKIFSIKDEEIYAQDMVACIKAIYSLFFSETDYQRPHFSSGTPTHCDYTNIPRFLSIFRDFCADHSGETGYWDAKKEWNNREQTLSPEPSKNQTER